MNNTSKIHITLYFDFTHHTQVIQLHQSFLEICAQLTLKIVFFVYDNKEKK